MRDIPLVEVQVYGETFAVPKLLCDELIRLRGLERGLGDIEREAAQARYEEQFGPLPKPTDEPFWVPVEG